MRVFIPSRVHDHGQAPCKKEILESIFLENFEGAYYALVCLDHFCYALCAGKLPAISRWESSAVARLLAICWAHWDTPGYLLALAL